MYTNEKAVGLAGVCVLNLVVTLVKLKDSNQNVFLSSSLNVDFISNSDGKRDVKRNSEFTMLLYESNKVVFGHHVLELRSDVFTVAFVPD